MSTISTASLGLAETLQLLALTIIALEPGISTYFLLS